MQHDEGFQSKLIRFNSRYRTADSLSATDFYIQLGTSEVIDNVFRVALIRFNCAYLFPNVDTYNNTLVVRHLGFGTPISVPVGQYDVPELAAVLGGAEFATTFNQTTSKFEFTSLADDGIILADSRFAQMLGITKDLQLAFAVPVSADSVPNLIGPKSIYVESPTLAQGQCLDANPLSGGSIPLLETIPLAGVPYGFVINYHNNDSISSDIDYPKAITLRRTHIRLTDSNTNALSLPPNQEVDIILKVFYRV
jgi:hypothetical protein